MNRRDVIIGSTLGLAAMGAAQAQTSAGPKGAGSGGAYIPTNYGQMAEIAFTTSTDLQAFMPPGLTVVDPHKAFIKAERVKLRSPEADKTTAAYSQYEQICITTMATTPKYGPRHRNILMWENRGWAVGGSMLGVKRYAEIHMPHIFDIDYAIAEQGGFVPFYVDVWLNNTQLMNFSGQLDGKKRIEHQPYPGFYVGGEPGQELLAMDLAASDFSHPLHGTGTLRFGALENRLSDRRVAPGGTAPFEQNAPPGPGKNWAPTLLKDIEVQGLIFQEFSFTRARGSEFHLVREATPGNGRSRL